MGGSALSIRRSNLDPPKQQTFFKISMILNCMARKKGSHNVHLNILNMLQTLRIKRRKHALLFGRICFVPFLFYDIANWQNGVRLN